MSKTFIKLQHIVVIQHFFYINRAFLIVNKKLKVLCHIIFLAASTLLCYNLVYDFYLHDDVSTSGYLEYIKQFQIILTVEVLYISVISRLRVNTFDAFKRLDEKCYIYGDNLEIGTNVHVIVCVMSIVCDVTGLVLLGLPASTVFILSTAFAAHDTECLFYSLLISVLNKRLQSLSTMSYPGRTRVYKHTLLAAAHFNEEYTFRISVIVFVTMVSSLVYSGVLLMSNGLSVHFLPFFVSHDKMMTLLIFLVWRETKVLYTLWLLCSATYKSEIISKLLIFDLAKKVAVETDLNDSNHDITRRWFRSVRILQPRYGNGSISMCTPLIILDLTFNYLIIIMQIHAEFISNKV